MKYLSVHIVLDPHSAVEGANNWQKNQIICMIMRLFIVHYHYCFNDAD